MKKQLHNFLLGISFLFFSTSGLYAFSGEGTIDEPYEITSVEQLQEMKDDLSAYYILMNDIDAGSTSSWNFDGDEYLGFLPVGDDENPFTGSLNGQGYTIAGLYINRPETDYVGLFGYIGEDGEVRDVRLIFSVVAGNNHVGGLAGRNQGVIKNSYARGAVNQVQVEQFSNAENFEYTIPSEAFDIDVEFVRLIGGGGSGGGGGGSVQFSTTWINGGGGGAGGHGYSWEGTNLGFEPGDHLQIIRAAARPGGIGGAVGASGSDGQQGNPTIFEWTQAGETATYQAPGGGAGGGGGTWSTAGEGGEGHGGNGSSGSGRTGGAIHLNTNPSGWETVIGSCGNAGRGGNGGSSGSGGQPAPISEGGGWWIKFGYSIQGKVTGTGMVGGLTGSNAGTIYSSYSTGNVSGENMGGGLVGLNDGGTVENCYSTGTAIRSSGTGTALGGFVGNNSEGSIVNSYSTGRVTYANATDPTDKGFAGAVVTTGDYEMSGNFWDIETSGQTGSAGGDGVSGFTTAQMKQQVTFADAAWDFEDTWSIISADGSVSYPYLTGNVQDPYPGLVAAWNGVGNWDETGNWFESTVPGEGADVRIHTGHLTINDNVDVGVMTVAPSVSLTLEADNTLTASRLTMESHGEYVEGARDNISVASFVNMGTVAAGVIEYQRYVPAGAFEYISSPLTGQKSDVFAPLSNVSGSGRGLFSFDVAGDDWHWIGNDETVDLDPMQGFAFISDVADVITFSGSTLHSSANRSITLNKGGTGFHLVGNPYAASVDWGNSAGWVRYEVDSEPAVSPVVWINYADAPGEGNFATYNYDSDIATHWVENIGVEGVIPPTQAFWVLVNELCTLQVNREAQVHSDNVLHKKSAATVVNPMLRLQAEIGGYRDEMVVLFHESATEGLDRYDTRKKMGSGSFPQLYTSVSGTDLAVNALPVEMLEEVVVVPVTLHSPGPGTYTVSLTELRGFDLFTEIHLADRQKDIMVSLRESPVYSFDLAATGDVTGRFELIIGDNTVTGVEELTAPEVSIYSHGRMVNISGAGLSDRWEIFNMMGIRLLEGQTEVDGTSVISTNLPVGIYMVVVHTSEGRVVKRVYIE